MSSRLAPSDYFLLDNWDLSSTESAEQQRARLCRNFVQLGVDGRRPFYDAFDASAPPVGNNSTEILEIARSSQDREIAVDLASVLGSRIIPWLRAYYVQGINPLDRANETYWISPDEVTNGQADKCVFDDHNRFNFGAEWQKIFDFFPEIVDCYFPRQSQEDIDDRIDREKVNLQKGQHDYTTWPQEIRDYVHRINIGLVHHAAVTGIMWLQDEETARTGDLAFLWLDQYGRVVRRARLSNTNHDAPLFLGAVSGHSDVETYEWAGGQKGEEYTDGA